MLFYYKLLPSALYCKTGNSGKLTEWEKWQSGKYCKQTAANDQINKRDLRARRPFMHSLKRITKKICRKRLKRK